MWSLAQGFLLPKDVHFFSGETDGLLVNWLQWHTIAIVNYPTLSIYVLILSSYVCHYCVVRPRS